MSGECDDGGLTADSVRTQFTILTPCHASVAPFVHISSGQATALASFPHGPMDRRNAVCYRTVKSVGSALTRRTLTVAILLLALGACREVRQPAQIQPAYDQNGKLRLLTYDSRGVGRPDTWAYMDGSKVVRLESDTAGTGTIDRWEYYDGDQKVRVELATKHDGRVTRREFYERGVLVRAEEDTAGRGRPDKWETYSDGMLTSVAFDTTGGGRPTRRMEYDASGQATLTSVSADPASRISKH